MNITTVGIVGRGALGMLVYDILAKHPHIRAAFLMDDARFDAHKNDRMIVNGREIPVRLLRASEASPVDLVIVAVKFPGLASAMDTIAPAVGAETTIISLLNGIASEGILAERFGADRVIPTVAQGMDAVFLDNTLRYSSAGKLRVGITDASMAARLDALIAFFEETGIPYVREADINYRLWSKFMLNVGVNQVCMVFDTGYGGAVEPGSLPLAVMVSAMREARMLAEAEGVALTEADIEEHVAFLATLAPELMPSMRQDRLKCRPSEVELFAGTVLRLAAKHGIAAPVNDWLYRRVKEIEAAY